MGPVGKMETYSLLPAKTGSLLIKKTKEIKHEISITNLESSFFLRRVPGILHYVVGIRPGNIADDRQK